MSSGAYSLRLARTLYENVYHAMLYNENQQPIGDLEIIPNIPLDRSQSRGCTGSTGLSAGNRKRR